MFTRAGLRSLFPVVALFVAPIAVMAAEPITKAAPKATPPTAALRSLSVVPAQVSLDGPRDEQRLAVLGEYVDGRRWDLSRAAKFASSAPKVASVDASGVIRASRFSRDLAWRLFCPA